MAACVIACGLLALAGCPRDLEIPDAAGPACMSTLDCNDGLTCGTLRACVLAHCEADASLAVPCEAGMPTDAGIFDAAAIDAR